MPSAIPSSLQAAYASGATTLAWGVLIERTDGQSFGWTSADADKTIGAVTYRAGPGLDVASLAQSAGYGVDNTELTVLADDTVVLRADILAGRWNNAAFTLFRYDWSAANDDIDIRCVGMLGELRPVRGAYVCELRGPQQWLQQPVGAVSTKTCRARLGDALCTVDLAPFTVTGTVTTATSRQVFTDSARSEADAWFAEGILTWTSGLNSGLSQKVKTYAADVFTLSLPMIFDVQVGDGYSVVAGCMKRIDEDCVAKFDNALNFQGEPHRPTVDDLTSSPEVSV